MRVIALLRGLLHRMVGSTALPTPNVGPVSPEPTTPVGSPCSVETTSLPPQPAPTQPSPSSEPAPKTTRARKRGNASKTALTQMAQQLTAAGSKSPTPAPRSLQRVAQAQKAVAKAAKRTKAAPKRTRDKAHVQTRTVNPSGDSGS
jgi:hypothetical protein